MLGEVATIIIAENQGWKRVSVSLRNASGHGIDHIFQHNGKWIIVESKAGLRPTLGVTNYGVQMSQSWIEEGLKKMRNLGGESEKIAREIQADIALGGSNVQCVYVKTITDNAIELVKETKYKLLDWMNVPRNGDWPKFYVFEYEVVR